jgi:hypothetical protein
MTPIETPKMTRKIISRRKERITGIVETFSAWTILRKPGF